ncbi:MAG: ribokinase [Sedimentisphaerales bacterium]|nr:ribokinase [Sedimentisphaerales bacterium]
MPPGKNESRTGPADSSTPDSPPHVVVIGGLHTDLVVRTSHVPRPGEFVIGHNFAIHPGGKGATQAVAAARCKAKVSMIGRVGNDDFGQRIRLSLQAQQVDISGIMVSEGISTGINMILVDRIGENAVCHAGGANHLLSEDDIDQQQAVWSTADVIIMQMEIPQQTMAYVQQEARHRQIPIILNPAPVPEAPQQVHPALFDVDVMIANLQETAQLCGEPANDIHSAKLAGSALVARGVRAVVITLGRRGALAMTAEQIQRIEPFAAKMVDSTGAGDAFCGAFAVAYARKNDLAAATRFAAAAGALACQKFGRQACLPHLEQIQRLLQRSC